MMETNAPLTKNIDYRSWVKELKQRYLSTRLKASIEVNRALLEYYWSVGRDIADKQYANTYGSGFYKTLGHDFRQQVADDFKSRNRLQGVDDLLTVIVTSRIPCA